MGRVNTRSSLVQTIDLQSLGVDLRIYGEIDDHAMRYFNPSIAFHDGKLKIAIRSCNFAVERQGKWYFRDGSAYSKTDVLYGDLDPNSLTVSNLQKLMISDNSPSITKLAGLEDVRLFSRKDGMHAIGFESDRLSRTLHNESASLAEYLIKGNELIYLRTLEKPVKEGVEKNWAPTDVPSDKFDFTYSPTEIWKDGKVIGQPTTSEIHGGSQLLKQEDGTYISIVHEKILDPAFRRLNHLIYDKFVYHTYLARHNEQGFITHLTKPFTFGTHENIEFASGMVEHENYFIISLGIRDCKFAIAKINRKKLIDLLEPVQPV